MLIQYAFDVLQAQIVSGPDWVISERYDIAAKAAADSQVDEIRAMLRLLLEDRFGLKYHWETRQAAIYRLVASKPGKLRQADAGECPSVLSGPESTARRPPDDAPCGGLRNSPGHTKGYWLTAGDLAGSLSFLVGRTVVDKTGLTGKYDVELKWTPETVPISGTETDAPRGEMSGSSQLLARPTKSSGTVSIVVSTCRRWTPRFRSRGNLRHGARPWLVLENSSFCPLFSC